MFAGWDENTVRHSSRRNTKYTRCCQVSHAPDACYLEVTALKLPSHRSAHRWRIVTGRPALPLPAAQARFPRGDERRSLSPFKRGIPLQVSRNCATTRFKGRIHTSTRRDAVAGTATASPVEVDPRPRVASRPAEAGLLGTPQFFKAVSQKAVTLRRFAHPLQNPSRRQTPPPTLLHNNPFLHASRSVPSNGGITNHPHIRP